MQAKFSKFNEPYVVRNGYAQKMFDSASDDYVSSRCLILNGMFNGFSLSAQAIEKILKAMIFLETGKKTTLKRSKLHNPYALKEELQSKINYKLDRYDVLLKRLYGHFQRRYFDNENRSRSVNLDELREVDTLWIYLVERISLPKEIKYCGVFFTHLFEKDVVKFLPWYRFWALSQNTSLMKKMDKMERNYSIVRGL